LLAGCAAPQRICPQDAGAPNITQEDFPLKKYRVLLVAMVIWLSLSAISYAQETRAVALGRVTDSSGASVPGAKVIAQSLDTGLTTSSVANEDGSYQINYLSVNSLPRRARTLNRYANATCRSPSGSKSSSAPNRSTR
jgi:hypothetical protein